MLPIGVPRLLAVVAALFLSSAIAASPPPPPSDHILAASKILVPTQTVATFASYGREFAGDVTVWKNGKRMMAGAGAWLASERARLGKVDRRVIGFSESDDAILVLDEVDDRSDLPDVPGALFDPRYVTRATLYRFGGDRLVHEVRILETGSFLQTP